MPKKYAIHTKVANPRFPPVGKFTTVEFREDCAGSCHLCVKKRCVYNIFKDNITHWSDMKDPEYLYICKSCYRCVEECTKGIFSMAVNPEYLSLGDKYWTPATIVSTWAQAHTGAIPVSGAGYRGPFVGEGFDSIWTDMSEIVRPTRDGIHGREYINTTVELSRRPMRLEFNNDLSLNMDLPPILEVPIPVLFQQPQFGILNENVLLAMARSAHLLGNLMFIKPESYSAAFNPYSENLVPCLTKDNYKNYQNLIKQSQMIELAYEPGIEGEFVKLRTIKPDLFISVSLPLNKHASEIALKLANTDVDTIHLNSNDTGRELNATNPRYLKDLIREVHTKLVQDKVRIKVNLVCSGGIALAEHVAKSLICGADAVTIDVPLLIALECRLCYKCKQDKPCPVKLDEIELDYGSQRIVNLMGAWRNQLLEVMGACGIREARRLRGEVGRSMWFEDLEKDSFSPIFGSRKVSGIE